MFRALLLVTALVATTQGYRLRAPLLDGRIVGGEFTTINEFPYQVSVRLLGSHICGGSILNSRAILTAAHCIYDGLDSLYTIQYGTTNVGGNSNTVKAQRTVKHKQYNPNTIDNDIALIFVIDDIPFSERAQPIELASKPPAPGTTAVVSGWGTTSEGGSTSSQLQQVKVNIVDSNKCGEKYAGVNEITGSMICAGIQGGGKDACQGDSGGPLAVNKKLVGVVSWGVGCARPEYPGVYTNLAFHSSWIQDNIASNVL